MSNFDPNAFVRGAQLTFVGANRALQNPNIFSGPHYRQAAIAVCAGLAIRLIINLPIYAIRTLLFLLSLVVDLDHETWDDSLLHGLDFIANSLLQVPFFLMTVMSSITPTLDNLFMDSLRWVDETYVLKHESEDPKTLRAMYYPMLKMYSTHGELQKKEKRSLIDGIVLFAAKYGRRAAISLAVYLFTFIPVVGRFVLPAASFYTFHKSVGPVPAGIIFACGLVVPKRYLVSFLQTYFSSRSLMQQLLQPYFHRIRFGREDKKKWWVDRSGVLFGFSAAFTVMIKIPIFGVLIYGIAEASTAYLITKITSPPPPPSPSGENKEYIESEVRWKNKHLVVQLPISKLDELNAKLMGMEERGLKERLSQTPGKKFS